MNEKMIWVSPKCAVQRFEANDHVAVCENFTDTYYRFSCNAFKGWREFLADLWVYKEQTGDNDTWMTEWTGNASNSKNLYEDGFLDYNYFTACGNTTEYLKEEEVNSIQRGWMDRNSLDVWSPTSGDAENFAYNVWIWTDSSGAHHASTDVDIHKQTTIGDHSK